MHKKVLLVLSASFLLTGCFLLPSRSNSQTTSEKSSDTSSGPTTSTQPTILGTREFDFTETSITTGTNLKNKVDALKAYMNKDGEVVSSINQENCTFQTVPDTSKTVLTVGTASYAGSISFAFSYQITQISVILQGYCKHIQYTTQSEEVDAWSTDANSKLVVNGHEFALGSMNENAPAKLNETITFDEPVTTITMENDDACQRAFVYKLAITYIVG